MLEHSQLNERLWQCNLHENGVNLGHMMTKSANNNQSINDISDLFMIAPMIHYSKMLLKLIFTACVVQVKKLKKEENLSRFLQINKTDPRYIIIAGKGTTSTALTWFTYMLQDKAATKINETTKTRNNVTNVVEFANGVSEESLEMMQYLHADFNGTIKTIMQFQWWKQYHQMPIYMLCGVMMLSVGYEVKKGDSVPYQPYGIVRVKFDKFEPERWFHNIVAFIQKAPLFPALQKHKRDKEFVWLKNLRVCR